MSLQSFDKLALDETVSRPASLQKGSKSQVVSSLNLVVPDSWDAIIAVC